MNEQTDLSRRYYEDLPPGTTFRTAGVTVTEDAIIRFAMEWDFQPIHIDRVAAGASMFGGLTSSGLQTFLLSLRLCNTLWQGTSVGLGMDELRFIRPVRPGMTLTVFATIADRRLSRSRPVFGIVNWLIETRDDRGETVCTIKMTNLMRRREALDSAEVAV